MILTVRLGSVGSHQSWTKSKKLEEECVKRGVGWQERGDPSVTVSYCHRLDLG